jgi:hypothetical protein
VRGYSRKTCSVRLAQIAQRHEAGAHHAGSFAVVAPDGTELADEGQPESGAPLSPYRTSSSTRNLVMRLRRVVKYCAGRTVHDSCT